MREPGERLLSVRERVFSTVRSRTAFTRARTDIICARTVTFTNGCLPPQHPFVNRYSCITHSQTNSHHPLCPHRSPELMCTVGWMPSCPNCSFTHRYHPPTHNPPMRARISQRQAPIHVYLHTRSCTGIIRSRTDATRSRTGGSRSRTILHPFMNGWAVRVGGRVWVITVEHRWLRCTHRYKQKTVREQVFPIYARTCITVRELAPVRARLISVHERVAFAFGDKHIQCYCNI